MTYPRSDESAYDRPGRATRPRGDARRRQILDAAVNLFAARGFNDVGIAEIANAVGITQAGLLHHYPTKAALLLAVLQERENRVAAEQARRQAETGDFIAAFLHILRGNEKGPGLVQLFAVLSAESLSATHPGHEWFVERYETVIADAARDLSEMIDESKLPPGVTVETIARWLHGLADGLRIQWLLDPSALNRHETVAQFAELLRPYLKRQETQWNDPTSS
ncbi:MAG: TetR/AcrR family transcriptional regulator [Leifsonia sp.]|jgi:AcrR family transcriptional regulator